MRPDEALAGRGAPVASIAMSAPATAIFVSVPRAIIHTLLWFPTQMGEIVVAVRKSHLEFWHVHSLYVNE
jgi:hypothetical protein